MLSHGTNKLSTLPHATMQVVAIAGTAFFSAAATASGLLHTWTSGGNLLLPPLALGCPAVRLQAQGSWGLLLVGADGELVALDFLRVSCRLCNCCIVV
jgi:hypothetical protein